MTKLTWEQLDACATEEEIVDLLRQYGIKGQQDLIRRCPLAVATGWKVFKTARLCDSTVSNLDYFSSYTALTRVECDFVRHFDDGDYPDLIL